VEVEVVEAEEEAGGSRPAAAALVAAAPEEAGNAILGKMPIKNSSTQRRRIILAKHYESPEIP
jgi:hypothetical protein